jgi:methanogenic corrinoid protein MtbC1
VTPARRETSLAELIVSMDERGSLAAIRRRLDAGDDPSLLMEECRDGVEQVGRLYEGGKYFISALIMAGEIFREAAQIIVPRLEMPARREHPRTFVIATVKGDIHDIGKNIMSTLLDAHGFAVVDLGVDVSPERITQTVDEVRPDILGLSCLLTSGLENMAKTVIAVRARTATWDRRLPIVIGGAPIDRRVCEQAGADGWCSDAVNGIAVVESLVGN